MFHVKHWGVLSFARYLFKNRALFMKYIYTSIGSLPIFEIKNNTVDFSKVDESAYFIRRTAEGVGYRAGYYFFNSPSSENCTGFEFLTLDDNFSTYYLSKVDGGFSSSSVNCSGSSPKFLCLGIDGENNLYAVGVTETADTTIYTYTTEDDINAHLDANVIYTLDITTESIITVLPINNGSTLAIALLENIHDVPSSNDPYNQGGESATGGGDGSFDDTSDPVPIPNLPNIGAVSTGFISLFVPSESQLIDVANYLWSDLFDLSTFLKIFENPMDCILGLSIIPVHIPTSGYAQITVGNIELSGISLPLAESQFVELDCGTIDFSTPSKKYFGSYLDFAPYTKMSLYVPYSGYHDINTDDVMGKVVHLVYHIDILTGALVAFLKCGESVLYQFNGSCATNIPITQISYDSTIQNAIQIATTLGTTVATGGATAPLAVGEMVGATVEGVQSLKPSIGRSGSLGSTTGLLSNQIPYFIITRPNLCIPYNQNKYTGYPSFITSKISDLHGYTELYTIDLDNLYLTDTELTELESLLKSGVWI